MPDSISFKRSLAKSPLQNESSVSATNTPSQRSSSTTSNSTPAGATTTSNSSSRRKALKEFYKIQEQQQKQLARLGEESKDKDKEGAEKKDEDKDDENEVKEKGEEELLLNLENFNEKISEIDFIKLVKYENEIKEVLNSNESEIKSIIYNNYYELIKINDVLLNLKDQSQTLAQSSDIIKGNNTNNNDSVAGSDNHQKEDKVDKVEEEGDIVIGSDEDEDEDEEITTATTNQRKNSNIKNSNEENEDGIVGSLSNIKKNLQALKKIDLNILPNTNLDSKSNDFKEHFSNERLSKCINRLILSNSISPESVKLIEEKMPDIQNESIRLQLNEIRNKSRV